MTLYETIYARKSVRNYRLEPISEKLMKQILAYEKELIPLYPDISYKLEVISNIERKDNVKGLFTVKAPYYLAIYSEQRGEFLLNAGSVMEQMSLYMASKGLGTCFLANARKKTSEKRLDNCHFVIIMAFGLPLSEAYRDDFAAKRLEVTELCVFKKSMNRQLKPVLEAARLAPSTFNSQPWRFVVYENRIHVFLKKQIVSMTGGRKWSQIDLGIMLAHILIAAEELWIDINVKKLDNVSNIAVHNNIYVTSVVFKM